MSKIELSGVNNESNAYTVVLDTGANTWSQSEPGGAKKVLTTKSGAYVYKAVPDKGTYLLGAGKKVVMFLRTLKDSSAKVGDKGNGNANESGTTVGWKVDKIT